MMMIRSSCKERDSPLFIGRERWPYSESMRSLCRPYNKTTIFVNGYSFFASSFELVEAPHRVHAAEEVDCHAVKHATAET